MDRCQCQWTGISRTSSGAAQGWLLWFGVMTAAAMAVIVLFSYASRKT